MVELKRSLSLPVLMFYGLGAILGAGIYVLVGKVAGTSGMYAPVSFILAAVLAGFTAFSYAELSSRLPKSSGVAFYIKEAFNRRTLATVVGLLVVLTGIVSAATLSRGFVGYFSIFFSVADWIVIVSLLVIMFLLAIWGIDQSAGTATVITLIELAGLAIIIWVGRDALFNIGSSLPSLLPPFEFNTWSVILIGSFLSFFAYIGFEDMVTVAEEVKNPRRTIPRAVILALVISTIFYILIALVAVLSLPIETLASTDAPLALIYEEATGSSPLLITIISLFAVTNGIIVQMIMGSRIVYGMSNDGWLPKFFSYVNPRTRTPMTATALVFLIILILALWLPLESLALVTVFITLIVFTMANLALIILKKRDPHPKDVHTYPAIIPYIGLFISLFALVSQLLNQFGLL